DSHFEGNPTGGFWVVFKHSERIKIINKNGFDAATIQIPLYVNGSTSEKVYNLKAITYNLENGKVVETKLDDASIFTNKDGKNLIEKKFTFPALKEGSIIEYSYTQQSEFLFNMQPWQFQGRYPCLWSEYQAAIPDFFHYVILSQGYLAFNINTTSSGNVSFHLTIPGEGGGRSESQDIDDNVVYHRWVIRNVPPLKLEPFTTTLSNYVAKVEFQLNSYMFPRSPYHDMMGNWNTLSKTLLEADYFGAELDRGNGWLDDDMKVITKDSKNSLEKAQKIYAYLRDNFTCTQHAGMEKSNSLKTVFKNRSGNVAEINLLLIAMLRHEQITTDPVILSTRAHGLTNEIYPLLPRFNYVIARAMIDDAAYYLDASESWLGFGRLPERCYNGHARVVSEAQPAPVYLLPDSIREGKRTLVIITNDEKSGIVGHVQEVPGYFKNSTLRETIISKGKEDYLKTLRASYSSEVELSNLAFDSLKMPDEPLNMSYDMKLKLDSNDNIIYFNPIMADAYRENPFKAADRAYPVEMPYSMDETYMLTMDIPSGYTVDEMPRSAKVLFNENEGFFEYIIQKSEDAIQLRCRIKMEKANFKPEDYSTLRDFFGYIVKKEGEQIVFKKKKSA
ncbi:MAG TPA: DUF3857 domain-containing protein, partial [Puia sp.]|nr:DUF3857 domain-containing protein [Puia sp.]